MEPGTAVAQQTEEEWEAELLRKGLTLYEVNRLRNIERNKVALAKFGVLEAASDIQKGMDQTKAKKSPKPRAPKRKSMTTEDGQPRKSARHEGKGPINYYKGEEALPRTVKPPRQRSGKQKAAPRKARDNDEPLDEMVVKDPVKAWFTAKGWTEEFGRPSDDASEAAFNAAAALAEELTDEGTHAFAKGMSDSQVAGGFWSSLPKELAEHYGTRRRNVLVFCDDPPPSVPAAFAGQQQSSSIGWEMVYLPRPTTKKYPDIGMSGGWRGFAIGNCLGPKDSVVFEVMENEDGEALISQHLGSTSAGRIHTAGLIALSAEEEALEAAGQSKKGKGKVELPSASTEPRVRGKAATAIAEGKVPAKHDRHGWGRMYARAHIFRAADYESEDIKQQQQAARAAAAAARAAAKAAAGQKDGEAAAAGADADVDAAGAADADADVRGSRRAKATPAAAAAAKGGAGSSKQQQSEQAAVASKKRARGVQDAQPKQQQQQDDTKPKKDSKTAAAAAAAGAKGSKKQGKRPAEAAATPAGVKEFKSKAAAAAGGATGANKKSKAAAAAAAGLVPQPANSKVLVPPPTDEEVQRNARLEDFDVEKIMGHKVVRGQDKFLIRWAGFGPYWDSWEGSSCLHQPPKAYSWQGGKQAIPAHLRK